jgi:hypothetical protein
MKKLLLGDNLVRFALSGIPNMQDPGPREGLRTTIRAQESKTPSNTPQLIGLLFRELLVRVCGAFEISQSAKGNFHISFLKVSLLLLRALRYIAFLAFKKLLRVRIARRAYLPNRHSNYS